jgi:hypothetical protein
MLRDVYKYEKLIGNGAFGVVIKVEKFNNKNQVAIKVK